MNEEYISVTMTVTRGIGEFGPYTRCDVDVEDQSGELSEDFKDDLWNDYHIELV